MGGAADDPDMVYLKEHRVYDTIDAAVAGLARARPADPAGWLAAHFAGRAPAESDAAWLRRTGARELVDGALVALLAARPERPAEFLSAHCGARAALQDAPLGSDGAFESPPRRRVERAARDDEDTPPTSPGGLIRGRSFVSDWTSQLQRYYLRVDAPGFQVTVHAGPSAGAAVTGTKREYDGIAVDKHQDGWLRITEGTGWVPRAEPGRFSWVPMGTEAGVVVPGGDIPGGFRAGQRVSAYSNAAREGEVVGGAEEGVLVRWDDAGGAVVKEEVSGLEIVSVRAMRRAPTMVWGSGAAGRGEYLVPPTHPSQVGLPVVVFDLDETLVYARQGPLHARAGVRELFAMLKDKAEVLVWTAGMRAYAQTIIKEIDPDDVVSHCVYRHPNWHPQFATGQSKDLAALGRPMDHTMLVENSPDSVVGHERHAVLLQDFVADGESDATIPTLYKLLRDFVYDPVRSVPDFLQASPYVTLTPMTIGEKETACFVLNAAHPPSHLEGAASGGAEAPPLERQMSDPDPNPVAA